MLKNVVCECVVHMTEKLEGAREILFSLITLKKASNLEL